MSIYISNSMYVSSFVAGGDFDANNPIIGYQSVLKPKNITVTATTSVRPAINAWTPDTAQVWEGQAYSGALVETTQIVNLHNEDGENIDYIGIGRHNLAENGFQYEIQSSIDGTTWVTRAGPKVPNDESAIVEYFDLRADEFWRIVLKVTSENVPAPIIGHIKLGVALVLQRRIFVGHQPASLARNTARTSYGSENGQYLGQIVKRSYYKTSIQQENNTAAFVRENIVPFIDHINGHTIKEDTAPATFFFAWRPGDYPDEVIYGWSNDNIQPENSGVGLGAMGRMSWGCSVEAIA